MPPGVRFDRAATRAAFDRAAASVDGVDVLAREVADRMAARFDYIRLAPERIIDAGCGTGRDLPLLRTRFPQAQLVGCDLSLAMLRRAAVGRSLGRRLRAMLSGERVPQLVAADLAALPFAAASASLVWSNLAIAWSDDLARSFADWYRVLAPGGLVMFSTYGPDTLRELREALAPHVGVHDFSDMHDIGDVLVHAGFADPVMDMELIVLEYGDLAAVVRDLRASGQRNVLAARTRGLFGPRSWSRVAERYERRRATNGKLPATFEIIYGHAWRAQPRRTADGRSIIELKPQRG